MQTHYTAEENTQILIALMKAHGIRKVVASPGTTNVCLVASLQQDPFFQLYSSVDERSAAYIACGLASASGEPVALSCTGATASRNYFPGLTEAYYRKLPILAITSTQHIGRIGHNIAQVIDRSVAPNDTVKLSVQIPTVSSSQDRWMCTMQINRALLELKRKGGGPVHINLITTYCKDFTVRELPAVSVVKRLTYGDSMPDLLEGRIAVFVGAHLPWSDELKEAVDCFCAQHNGVVVCDQTSNYRGQYRVLCNIVTDNHAGCPADLVIYIGDISGAYTSVQTSRVWRVNPDGELRDTFGNLQYIFEMQETDFFRSYCQKSSPADGKNTYLTEWINERNRITQKIPELPFSNLWIAQHTAEKIPADSLLYLGILNTLRAWNYFETPDTVTCYSNTGGFGIDGGVSTLLGLSLADLNRLCFGVVGDLGFFYDMNALGNRHVGNNLRLMIINNGCGTEFRNFNHFAFMFGEDANDYIAAEGHYGKKSTTLVKDYAENLGFTYLCASDKDSYLENEHRFLCAEAAERPIVFEVFTNSKDESDALRMMRNLEITPKGVAKEIARKLLGDDGVRKIRKILKK